MIFQTNTNMLRYSRLIFVLVISTFKPSFVEAGIDTCYMGNQRDQDGRMRWDLSKQYQYCNKISPGGIKNSVINEEDVWILNEPFFTRDSNTANKYLRDLDINECVLQTDQCDVNATCLNTIGSYSCSCNPGFFGTGFSCQESLSCENQPHDIHCSTVDSILPRDCYDIQSECSCSKLVNGIYEIHPSEYPTSFSVYCDFDADDGGWTLFQRRIDGSVNFERKWQEYKEGFGVPNKEFWLGNDKLYFITAQKIYELRIDLANKVGDPFYAIYDSFRIFNESNFYKLILGQYTGNTTADSLDYHRDQLFTTMDVDNDKYDSGNCASRHGGGWWFNACDYANLNAPFGVDRDQNPPGMEWSGLPGGCCALKFSEMKIRPLN